MHSEAAANNLPGSLRPVFSPSGKPTFHLCLAGAEVSVHKFTEMTIMLLTLRLDSASRPCTELSQHPSSFSLSTYFQGWNKL